MRAQFFRHNVSLSLRDQVLCAILTKFTGSMRILMLHNSVKFGCYSLINNKATLLGAFSENF